MNSPADTIGLDTILITDKPVVYRWLEVLAYLCFGEPPERPKPVVQEVPVDKKAAKSKGKAPPPEPEAPSEPVGLYPAFPAPTQALALRCLSLLLSEHTLAHAALQGKWLAGALRGSLLDVRDAQVAAAGAALLAGLCEVQVRPSPPFLLRCALGSTLIQLLRVYV